MFPDLYQHRWLSLCVLAIVLFVIGYAYGVHPVYLELEQLQQTKVDLLQQLAKMKIKSNAMMTTHSRNHFRAWNALPDSLLASGLIIPSMTRLPLKQDNIVVRLSLLGSYQQWLFWLQVMARQVDAISVQHLSCQSAENNQVKIVIDIMFAEDKWKQYPIFTKIRADNKYYYPFCQSSTAWNKMPDEMLHSPLAQIKMKGYLQFNTQRAAIVLLPTREMSMIKEGDVLGLEKGVVHAIYRDHVQVRLKEKKEMNVWMEK